MNETSPAQSSRLRSWFVWISLAVVLSWVLVASLRLRSSPSRHLPILGQVSAFSLTNQFGQPVSLADLRGQVWVADVIFTRCPGPCPQMSGRLKEIQAALPTNAPVRLVSLTSDPEFDTVPVLQAYARRFGADSRRWMFLTGPNPDIRDLAVHGLKLVLLDKKPEDRSVPEDLFIHSTLFIVVDKQGRIRQSIESLEDTAMGQTLAAILTLLQEE